jgi:hypothetical protein
MTMPGVNFFQYVQSNDATVWNIYHGMGNHPMVETNVYVNGVLEKAFPISIVHLDSNTVRITWSQGRRGFASLACTVA